MIKCKTKEWGNSVGVIIPSEVVREMNIGTNEEIILEIKKKENPLRELWGFGKGKKLTQKTRLRNRKFLESKYC